MMTEYILSILGIVLLGVMIDVIIPSGSISKFIKSLFGIFVLAVIIMPVIKFFNTTRDFNLEYTNYELNQTLLNYINNQKVLAIADDIETELYDNGFSNIDIKINYSTNDNNLTYNSCEVNLKNLVISKDKQHINKYEFIIEVIKEYTNLVEEVIIFYE